MPVSAELGNLLHYLWPDNAFPWSEPVFFLNSSCAAVITWNHDWFVASRNCVLLLGCFSLTIFLGWLHRFLIGLRSGLFPGHSSSVIWLSWNHVLHTPATWHWVESWWHINASLWWKRSRAEGFSISFMHLLALILPVMTQILPTHFDVIQPHIITPTGCFMVGVMQSGCKSSPILLLTYFMPSLPNKEILVPSLQITLSHCSTVQLTCFF